MRIVGIDTSAVTASVALVEDGIIVAENIHPSAQEPTVAPDATGRVRHAEILLPMIDDLLRKLGWSVGSVSGVAVSIGPGSFTGLRVGLSTVKGLVYGWGVKVVGVPTLQANAARVTDWSGLICSLLDARKKEVYAALFRNCNGRLERLSGDLVAPAQSIIEIVQNVDGENSCLFIGEGVKVYRHLLEEILGKKAELTIGDGYPSVAGSAARLAEERLRRGDADPPEALVPLYLRSSVVELSRPNSLVSG